MKFITMTLTLFACFAARAAIAAPATRPTTEPASSRVLRQQIGDAVGQLGVTFECGEIRGGESQEFVLENISIRRADPLHPKKTVMVLTVPEATISVGGWPAKETPLRLISVHLNRPALRMEIIPPQPNAPALPPLPNLPWGLDKLKFPAVPLPEVLTELKYVSASDGTVVINDPSAGEFKLTISAAAKISTKDGQIIKVEIESLHLSPLNAAGTTTRP